MCVYLTGLRKMRIDPGGSGAGVEKTGFSVGARKEGVKSRVSSRSV